MEIALKEKSMYVWLVLAALLIWTNAVEAACTGSSPTWTAASPSSADVAACVTVAKSGDTIRVPAGSGSVNWSTPPNLPNTKGLTILGPGAGSLTINNSKAWIAYCSASKPHRISGFRFTGTPSGGSHISVEGTCSGFRIDHNIFYNVPNGYEAISVNAGVALEGPLYGLIDNNQFVSTGGNFRAINMNSGGMDYGVRTNWRNESHLGTANNIYIEDNVFDYATQDDGGSGAVDSNSEAAWVFRFNTVKNSSIKSHGVCNSEGTANQSAYYNTFVATSGVTNGYRMIHQQGSGEAMVFANRFTAASSKSASAFEILHYRSANASAAGCSLYPRCDGSAANAAWDQNRSPAATYKGYRCRYQPGSRGGPNGTTLLSPIYAWNNIWTDNGQKVSINIEDAWNVGTPTVQDHVKANRDFYDAVSNTAQTSPTSPFNGTTGVGFGTLANRPTTCTTNPDEPGGGVGYWATDQGEWNSKNAGPDGQLYRCSATNVWTLHYTPFTYPHPLQTGGSPVPPAPTNLRMLN
ncbi:MAG: hypothetical protein U1F54_16055 [Burkholderiales bacterium]